MLCPSKTEEQHQMVEYTPAKEQEFWRWEESRWTSPTIDWQKASIITAGVDIGSVSSKAAIMCDGELYAYANGRTGADSANSARTSMAQALEGTGLEIDKIHYIIGTGYGRVNVPFAHRTITEIACHARGANFMYGPTVRTVLDMGGQDCKASPLCCRYPSVMWVNCPSAWTKSRRRSVAHAWFMPRRKPSVSFAQAGRRTKC